MKLRYKILIVTLLFYNYSNAQDDNTISLYDLSSCAMKFTVDDAEKVISKYGFHLVVAEKVVFRGKKCDRHTFIKESEGVKESIYLYKNEIFDPFDETLKVAYSCFFGRNYNKYKMDMEGNKNNIFSNEKISGECFERNYEGNYYNYTFTICKTQYPDNPMYILIINFTHGKGF